MLLDMDYGTVEVDTVGSGPGLVIIHSLLTGPEAFDEVTRSLASHLTVHRIFLPGCGESSALPIGQLSIRDLAEVVSRTMARLECPADTVVLGNGLGSFVALSLAIHYGDFFGPLIACNTGASFPEERKGAFTAMSELARGGGMAAVAEVAAQRIFPPSYFEIHPTALEERRLVLERIDPTAFSAACEALAMLDLGADLHRIANRTLVITGAIDQTTPPEMGRQVAEAIPDACIVEIPDCGHCPQLEQPEALQQAIRGFLAS